MTRPEDHGRAVTRRGPGPFAVAFACGWLAVAAVPGPHARAETASPAAAPTEVPIELNVVGFGVDDVTRKQLEEMAAAAGGRYFRADDEDALRAALGEASGAAPPSSTPRTACGFALSEAAFRKWTSLGAETGVLGCPAGEEAAVPASALGTTGHVVRFSSRAPVAAAAPASEGSAAGVARGGAWIAVVDSGERAGQAFEVHGCMADLYERLGGTASWLGFPASDVFVTQSGYRSDFEAGYITWERGAERCDAFRHGTAK